MKKEIAFVGFKNNMILSMAYYLYSFFMYNKKVFATSPIKIIGNKVNVIQISGERSRGSTIHNLYEKNFSFMCNVQKVIEKKKPLLICFLNKIYKTNKFVSLFIGEFSSLGAELIVDTYYISQQKPNIEFVLPNTFLYKKFGCELSISQKIKYSTLLTFIIQLISVIKIIRAALGTLLRNKIKIKKRVNGLILREMTMGFDKDKIYRDNMFATSNYIKSCKMIYFARTKNGCRGLAYNEAVKANETILDFEKNPKMINLNHIFFGNLFYNCLAVPVYILLSLFKTDFLTYLPKTIDESKFFHKLISFSNAKWYFACVDYGWNIQTITLNVYGIKSFLYHWSDYTAVKGASLGHQSLCNNIIFSWGPIMQKYIWNLNSAEIIKDIGCPYKTSIKKTELREKYSFPSARKIISFYDTSWDEKSNTSEDQHIHFYKAIEFLDSELDPNIQILIKPKNKLSDYYKNLMCKNFSERIIILNPNNYPVQNIIKLSDINIGCGLNSTVTISLINNIPGIYFDESGNTTHPMTKYEGDIFVRNNKGLLNSINKYLDFKGDIRSMFPEIEDYDVAYIDNPIKEIAKFLYANKDVGIDNLKK